jgi:hypothetical protein
MWKLHDTEGSLHHVKNNPLCQLQAVRKQDSFPAVSTSTIYETCTQLELETRHGDFATGLRKQYQVKHWQSTGTPGRAVCCNQFVQTATLALGVI